MTDSTPHTGTSPHAESTDAAADAVLDKPSQAEGEDTGVEAPEPQAAGVEDIGKPSQAEGEDDASATE